MTTFLAPFTLAGCLPDRIEQTAEGLHVHATGSAPDAACATCGRRSDRVHSYYLRSPADLPISDQSVRLHLRLRRFRCLNERCERRTFVEPLPKLLSAYARRTDRLAETQTHVGFAMGAEAGARLLDLLRMSTSPDTLLRTLHRHPLPEEPVPRVLGVDDWAWRKGRAWGTILIDLEKRRPVDVLPDRTADGLKRWLEAHPGIEVVARDRSTEYARGITEGAPEAMQVADRWHLLHNFRQVVERFLHAEKGRLQALKGLDAIGSTLSPPPQRRSEGEVVASEAAREARLGRYVEARRLSGEEGLNISQISQALGMSRTTVRKYLSADAFPEWSRHSPRPSILAPYESYLERRWAEGARSALGLFREIKEQGYAGSTRPVSRWARERRTKPHPCTPKKYRADCLSEPKGGQRKGKLPAPRRLAWLLVRDPETLSSDEAQLLDILRGDAAVGSIWDLARSYVSMIRERTVGNLDSWISSCISSGIAGFDTFAAGLQQDYAAVRAALTEPWSSGQAEGQINRLKTLKRQMYGRASFNLLRKRILYRA